jgi:hypothetical protein
MWLHKYSFLAGVCHGYHEILVNHPFPINNSFDTRLLQVNGWPEGFHGRHNLGFVLGISIFLTV